MGRITLEQANVVANTCLARGRELGLNPLTVAVLDAGGHLVALQRADRSSNARPQIAIGKAAGALALGMSSRAIAAMAAERPTFIGALNALSPAGVVPAAGGIILVDEAGEPIGAVGVTGDSSDNDEACAHAGAAAAGLKVQG